MSYIVFARKWRPLTFDDVVGQQQVTRTLKLAIEKQRVAHAYLFTGTRGVGKTTTARIFARAMNCEKGPTPQPCGECDSCRSISQGSSFDVLEIDGASNNSVEDVRELRENVNYSSMGGKYRIYVIDEVHMLSKSAFNALLKTLEEPPKNVIFIFATTEPQKIPETILSRCQRYDFRRISAEQILGQLERICTSEQISFEREGLVRIALRADGSMRDALGLLDQVCSFCQESIKETTVREVLGIVGSDLYQRLTRGVAEKDASAVLSALEEVLYGGYDLAEFLSGFQEHIRNLLVAKIPGLKERGRPSPPAESDESIQTHAAHFSEGDLLRMSEILRKAEYELKWSAYPRFCVENALLKLVYLDRSVSMEQLLSVLRDGGERPGAPYVAAPRPEGGGEAVKKNAEAPAAADTPQMGRYLSETDAVSGAHQTFTPPVLSAVQEESGDGFGRPVSSEPHMDPASFWPRFLEHLIQDRPNIGTFLSLAYIASSTENSIDLRFQPQCSFQFSEVTKKNNRMEIMKKMHRFAGRPIDLHMTLEKRPDMPPPQPLAEASRVSRSPSLQDDMENEPVIRNVIEIFNGEPV